MWYCDTVEPLVMATLATPDVWTPLCEGHPNELF